MKALAAILGWIAVTFAIPGEADLGTFLQRPGNDSISIGKSGYVDIGISADPISSADFKGKEKVWAWHVHETVTRQRAPELECPIFPVIGQNDRAAITTAMSGELKIMRYPNATSASWSFTLNC